MYGVGFPAYNHLLYDDDGFVFSDADAEAYYNALVIANGGDIDAQSIYGISLTAFKQTIEDFVVSCKADSVWVKLKDFYPFMGGTDVTHAINMNTALTKLTYVGSPTHGAGGMTLNGTTQYADFNVIPDVDFGQFSIALVFFANITNGVFSMGSRNTTNKPNLFRWLLGSNDLFAQNHTNLSSGAQDVSKVCISSMIANNDSRIYVDGINVASALGVMSKTNSDLSSLLGATDNTGSVINYGGGSVKCGAITDGLSAANVTDLTTHIETLNTSLGR